MSSAKASTLPCTVKRSTDRIVRQIEALLKPPLGFSPAAVSFCLKRSLEGRLLMP
jgi:hypothetical protein